MIPGHLIDQYWSNVATELEKKHGKKPDAARKAIEGYRKWLAEKQIGELVYHQEVEQTAEAILQFARSHTATSVAIA